MRTLDYKMNATGICSAAGLKKAMRDDYLKTFKRRGLVTPIKFRGQKQSWVPFQDGVFLCQALNLFDELIELFLQAPINVPSEEENYLLTEQRKQAELPDGYKALLRDKYFVAYMPSTRRVNATQLLKLSHVPRRRLGQYFSQNPQVSKYVLRGNASAQGTYVDFEDARQLCRQFDLSQRPIDDILLQESTDNEHIGNVPNTSLYSRPSYGPNYEIGSLFASADRCFLQLVNNAQ